MDGLNSTLAITSSYYSLYLHSSIQNVTVLSQMVVITKVTDPLNPIEACLFQHKDHTDILWSTRSSAALFLMHSLKI